MTCPANLKIADPPMYSAECRSLIPSDAGPPVGQSVGKRILRCLDAALNTLLE